MKKKPVRIHGRWLWKVEITGHEGSSLWVTTQSSRMESALKLVPLAMKRMGWNGEVKAIRRRGTLDV